jgi:hypothetical protein
MGVRSPLSCLSVTYAGFNFLFLTVGLNDLAQSQDSLAETSFNLSLMDWSSRLT